MSSPPIAAPDEATAAPSRRGLVLYAVLSFGALGVGGWLTSMGFGPWYDELQKPPFQPPGWVFSPVWTTLFALLAYATWRVSLRGERARRALGLYGIQLVLNVGWSLLFFALHRPAWALVDILLLEAVVIAMVFAYGRLHRPSGWCLVPYAVWLALATAINVWIVVHN